MFLAGLGGGGGGVTGGDQTATGGNADLATATGDKNLTIGGNPNVQRALQSPWLVVAALVVIIGAAYLWRRR